MNLHFVLSNFSVYEENAGNFPLYKENAENLNTWCSASKDLGTPLIIQFRQSGNHLPSYSTHQTSVLLDIVSQTTTGLILKNIEPNRQVQIPNLLTP